jgi:hypothetical protein
MAQRAVNADSANGAQHTFSFALPFALTTVIASALPVTHLTTTQLVTTF